MTPFDILYLNAFNYYKANFKKSAGNIALIYVSCLQISLILLLGVFFAAFFKQMNINTMSPDKAWTMFILVSIFICFKNWMQYSGRKRSIINAKLNRKGFKPYNIWLLWTLPLGCFALSITLMKVL